MCSPTVALFAGQQVLGGLQQEAQFRADEQSEKARHRIEVDRAKRDAEISRNMLDQQALEDSYATNDEREQLALESLREAGDKLATGSTGVSSVRSMLATAINEDLQEGKIDLNEQNALFRNQAEQAGIGRNYQDRIQNSRMRVEAAKSKEAGVMKIANFHKKLIKAPISPMGV